MYKHLFGSDSDHTSESVEKPQAAKHELQKCSYLDTLGYLHSVGVLMDWAVIENLKIDICKGFLATSFFYNLNKTCLNFFAFSQPRKTNL